MGHAHKNLLRPVDTGPSAHSRHVCGTDAPGGRLWGITAAFWETRVEEGQRRQTSAPSGGCRGVGGRAEHTRGMESVQRSGKRTPGYYGRKEGESCQPKSPKSPDSRKSRTKVGVAMADLPGSTVPELCGEDRGAAGGRERQCEEASREGPEREAGGPRTCLWGRRGGTRLRGELWGSLRALGGRAEGGLRARAPRQAGPAASELSPKTPQTDTPA